MPNNSPLESVVQNAVVDYLDILERQWKVLWFTWSWNWQFQKSIKVKMKMRREWIRAGMPDLFIVLPKNIIFIELKREKWGKPTNEQIHAIEAINKSWDWTWNYSAFLAYWFKEAKEIIDSYIS
jgi:hypothetical protein